MMSFGIASPCPCPWPVHMHRYRCHLRAYAHMPCFSTVVLWSLNPAWHFFHGARPANPRFLCRFPMCIHQARRTCACMNPIARAHIRDCVCGHCHFPCACGPMWLARVAPPPGLRQPGREGYKNQQQKRNLTASANAQNYDLSRNRTWYSGDVTFAPLRRC